MNRILIALDARLYRGSSSGDSTYWTGLIDALFASDHEFEIRLFSNREAPSDTPEGVRQNWVTIPARNGRIWSLVMWPSVLRRLSPSLVHTQYSLPFALPGRRVTTVHDVSFCIQPSWFSPKDRWLLKKGVGSAIARADMVITISETSRLEIESAFPNAKGKTRVAHLAGNPALADGRRLDAPPFMLSVSTQWPRKNMQLAIDAVSLLPKEIPHRLVLSGKAGTSLSLNARVHTTGYISESELADLYASADLYLCPSLHEGFGLPIVEAFAAGCPVLSSRGGSLPEVGGDACEYLDDWNPQHWAAKIESLLRDSGKLATMKEAGLKRAQDFSWEKCAKMHLEFYREAMR